MYREPCVNMRKYAGSRYDPPEVWCEINPNLTCDDCPYYSSEEYEIDITDYGLVKETAVDFFIIF